MEDKPLLRPLFYDFPAVMSHIENLTEQYMVGDSLMVVPVTLPDMRQVSDKHAMFTYLSATDVVLNPEPSLMLRYEAEPLSFAPPQAIQTSH